MLISAFFIDTDFNTLQMKLKNLAEQKEIGNGQFVALLMETVSRAQGAKNEDSRKATQYLGHFIQYLEAARSEMLIKPFDKDIIRETSISGFITKEAYKSLRREAEIVANFKC